MMKKFVLENIDRYLNDTEDVKFWENIEDKIINDTMLNDYEIKQLESLIQDITIFKDFNYLQYMENEITFCQLRGIIKNTNHRLSIKLENFSQSLIKKILLINDNKLKMIYNDNSYVIVEIEEF